MTPKSDPAVDRLLDQREAQGLPRHVDDPDALARIVAVLLNASRSEAA